MAEGARDVEVVVYENPETRVPDLEDAPVHRISVRSSRYSLSAQFELARRCRDDKLDIFHSPFYIIPFAASCPVVVTLHDVIPFLFPIYSRPKQSIVRMGYRMAAYRATHFIAVSHASARDIRKVLHIPEERISIVHLAASRGNFHPDTEKKESDHLQKKYGVVPPFVVVASPRNWHTKNLRTAFDALALAQGQLGKRFQTVVYGPGTGTDALADCARCQDLDLVHTGFLRAKDLGIVFRHAGVFILSSLYEGFGLPILEAMSCGCPVVTSNGGSLAEVAGDGAQVFDPMDTRGMAEAVGRLLSDANEAKRWRSRGLARASEFSWRKAAEQTIAVYRKVCHSTISDRQPDLDYRRDPESTHY
jgi:alpha-1,3-rhamnosyl/mannosyltransferase